MKMSKKSKKMTDMSFDSRAFDEEADEMEEDIQDDDNSDCNVFESPERQVPHTGRMRVKLHGQDAANWDDGVGHGSPEETKPTLLNTLQAPINRNLNTQK